MCIAITKKNQKCQLAPKKEYCHIHNSLFRSLKFSERTTTITAPNDDKTAIMKVKKTDEQQIKNLKEDITNKNKALQRKNEKLKKANDIITILEEKARNYEQIVEFENFKNKIKTIYGWSSPFYIEDIREDKKYHSYLIEQFNMSIEEIIKNYYIKRRIRNSLCHPF